MTDDYKFSVEDELLYVMFLKTTTTVDVTKKEGILYRLNRIRNRFNEHRLGKLINKIKESTDEEFEAKFNEMLKYAEDNGLTDELFKEATKWYNEEYNNEYMQYIK